MPAPLRLSVLDQSPISEGSTGAQALRNTLDLARLADVLGYHRYWVAEHHGGPMLAGPSPEALIGPIASATERLRVGSGGVMLPHYSPLKVAETFSLLSGLFPGRIDLALGRAPGTDPVTTLRAPARPPPGRARRLPQQLAELLGYLDDNLPADHPFARLAASCPGCRRRRSRGCSAPRRRARSGRPARPPYAFADFINPEGAEIADALPRALRASAALRRRRWPVGVWAIAAPSDEEAERLAASSRMAMTLLRQGRLIPVPPVERRCASWPRSHGTPHRRRACSARPRDVRAGIEESPRSTAPRRRSSSRSPTSTAAPALLRADRRRVRAERPPARRRLSRAAGPPASRRAPSPEYRWVF
jgi:luciferase family oxidoreductase group 1